MIELKINAESEPVKAALTEFIKSYKEAICDYINLELRDKGNLADSYITVDKDVLTVYQVTPEKGYVLGEIDDISKWEMIKWSVLEQDKLYIKNTKEGLTLYIKSEQGIPDVKIGQFKSLDDAVTQMESESVRTAILSARESKKAQLKQIKKLEKLGKGAAKPTLGGSGLVTQATDEQVESRVQAEQESIESTLKVEQEVVND